jgi:hypothetical protein
MGGTAGAGGLAGSAGGAGAGGGNAAGEAGGGTAGGVAAGAGGAAGDGGAAGAGACEATGLTEDLTGSNWHVVGRVNGAAAFAIGVPCAIDASSFSGIEFTIKGTAGTPSELRVEVGFAGDTLGSRDVADPRFGTCEYDCASPGVVIPVTADETVVRLPGPRARGTC